MEIAVGIAERMSRREWTVLASVVGVPSLPAGGVAGRIDADLPPPDQDRLLAPLLAESPAIRSAQANVERAEASLHRAKREPIPDLIVQGGLQQNLESLDVSQIAKSACRDLPKSVCSYIYGIAIRERSQLRVPALQPLAKKCGVWNWSCATASRCTKKITSARA